MKKLLMFLCMCISLGACRSGAETGKADHRVVSSLDLERFMGTWYEIARYDHRFERGMTHVTATYTLLETENESKPKDVGNCPILPSRANSRYRSFYGFMPTIMYST